MGENVSLPREFYAISVAGFLFNLTGNVIQPIQTLYVLSLGASLLQIGLLYSAQTISVALLRIPLTLLSHKVGEDRMIGIGFLVRVTAFLFYFAAPSYPWLIPIALYEVIANGSFFQLTLTKASNMLPPARQGDAMGRFMTFIMLGMFVGPLITGSLVTAIGYRQLFLVASTFPLAGMILFVLTSRGKEASSTEEDQLSAHKPQVLGSLKTIIKDRNVLMLSAIRTLYFMSNAMFMAFFAVYAVNQLNLDASVVALLFSVQGFVNTFVKVPAGNTVNEIALSTGIPKGTVAYYVRKFNRLARQGVSPVFVYPARKRSPDDLAMSFLTKAVSFRTLLEMIRTGDFERSYYYLNTMKLLLELRSHLTLDQEERKAFTDAIQGMLDALQSSTPKQTALQHKTLEEVLETAKPPPVGRAAK